jgi:hypothetical protein
VFQEENERPVYKYFLTAYCNSHRHVGGKQKTHTYLFIKCVRTILPDTPASVPLKTWIHEAVSEIKWNALIRVCWGSLNDDDDEEEDLQTYLET